MRILLYDYFDQTSSLLGCLNQNWGSMQVSHAEKLGKTSFVSADRSTG